ncbi:hemoglobin/transferrin/lactoferrin receptor protein [Catalinimonas alkaloidigena]|uniref:TonB-dependent receptor plug domain-containing protein n=1 Tax=Catalinimonas alkaloidigena TaxID=1075417 RepID=UPI002405EF7A|nr:TonB-dependent receptor [Catalinimonas alkaloidigena]MDF9795904.1 hemoglobin/transferrin/lactoferrin receptor protein [Catalinimonas alkaloidigena]
MKETSLILSVVLSLSFFTQAQTLKVVDITTSQGIPEVVVYSSDRTFFLQTNTSGEVYLANFTNSDSLYFQHPAYQDLALTLERIRKADFVVSMREKVIQMEEAVITVNRWEQKKAEIPHQIVSMKPSDIAFENPQTAADLLDRTGQVFVQKSQLGGGSPMLRGFAANAVLIVVDGVRMNNAIFRGGNLQNVINIDPTIIEEAEVVFGPGSVIYGSDALGGVMDFHTRTPAYASSDSFETETSAMVRYASANQEKTGHIDVSLKGKRLSSLTSFSYSDFDDLRAGSQHSEQYPDFGKRYNYVVRARGEDSLVNNPDVNVQVPSAYRQLNLMQKLRYRLTDKIDLVYGLIYSTTSDIPRYDRLIVYDENGLPEDAEWYYGPQKWAMHSIKARLYDKNPFFDEAKLTLAYQGFEESRNDRGFQRSELRRRVENVNAYTLNFDADKVFNQFHHLFYGIEVVHNTVASEALRENLNTGALEPSSTRYPDGGSDYSTAAFYLNHKWNFNKRFTLNTGLRYSGVCLTSRFTDSSFYKFPYDEINLKTGAMSGSAGLVFRPAEGWQLNFLLSSGFRAPNLDDVGKVFDSEPGNVVVPNPNLGPEYSYNVEIGASKSVENKFRVEGVVYYSSLRDAMVRRNFSFNGMDSIVYDGEMSRVQAIVNAGEAYVFGFSMNATYSILSELALYATLTYTTGRDLEEDAALRHAAPTFGSTAIKYQSGKFIGEFNIRYNGAIVYQDLAPSEQNKPYLYTEEGALSWYTLNLTTSYQLNQYIQISGGLENILDKHYWPYSSGIGAPGRNFVVSLRTMF